MASAVVFVKVTMRTYSDEMFVERHRISMRPLFLTFFLRVARALHRPIRHGVELGCSDHKFASARRCVLTASRGPRSLRTAGAQVVVAARLLPIPPFHDWHSSGPGSFNRDRVRARSRVRAAGDQDIQHRHRLGAQSRQANRPGLARLPVVLHCRRAQPAALSGQFDVVSAPGRGRILTCTIPLKDHIDAAQAARSYMFMR